MQGEFEKQVQQKMETLRLVPSEPVWQKVELAIRKEKNKRRFLFLLLFALMVGAGGLWYHLNTGSSAAPKFTIAEKSPSAPRTSTTIAPRPLINKVPVTFTSHTTLPVTPTARLTRLNTLETKQIPTEQAISVVYANMPETSIPASMPPAKDSSGNTLQKANTLQQNPILTSLDSSTDKVEKDTITSNIIDKQALTLPVETLSKQPVKKPAASKWQKIVYFQVGSSSFREKMFSSGTLVYADPSALSNSPGGSGVVSIPQTTPAISYAIGGGVVKNIKKRWQWTAAIQYQYYSTHTKTGIHFTRDTFAFYGGTRIAVQDYLANTAGGTFSAGSSTYANKISLVQINPSIAYGLSRNIPLKLDLGMSYGLLLKSTTLTYDRSNNIFYLNKDNNLKNFIQFTSSLQYEFGTKTKILVAPVFQYSLTKLQRYTYGNTAHLSFWGLRSGIKF